MVIIAVQIRVALCTGETDPIEGTGHSLANYTFRLVRFQSFGDAFCYLTLLFCGVTTTDCMLSVVRGRKDATALKLFS